jgi:hypothetical protein
MTRRRWTPQEIALMRELYPHVSSGDMAARLGMTIEQVYWKASKLGLRKTREYLVDAASGRLTGADQRGAAHRFAAGDKPWNKGLKGILLSPGTTFKPGTRHGNAARNWVPVDSLRVNPEGYLVRKVADVVGAPQHHNWRAVHRIVWEAAHGPVPPGHAVAFLPGRHSTQAEDITPDALELVSRSELMRRNSVQRYPTELRRLVQLRGALSRVINNREKKGTE